MHYPCVYWQTKRDKLRMTTLDRTDLRMLAVLQGEGRITNAELAERISLSPSAFLRRLQRLDSDRVITGYAAQIEPAAAGLGVVLRGLIGWSGGPGAEGLVFRR